MSVPATNSRTFRFGAFEADLRSGELRRDGIKVKLEGQPIHVLAVLLERPGQLVTREELQKELWPDETFVDFEQGINAAVKRLRVALDDSADKPRFIETLPRRGYRFIAQVESGIQPAPSAADEGHMGPTIPSEEPLFEVASATHSALAPNTTIRRRPVILGLVATICIALLVLGFDVSKWLHRLPIPPRGERITSIAVLPFQNLTGDPAQEHLADGMTEALIAELGKINTLRVISRTSAMAFKGEKKPLPEIGRQLRVDAVLEGAIAKDGDAVRITVRLIHLPQERTLWAETFEEKLRDVSALQNRIAPAIAHETKIKAAGGQDAP